MSKSKDKQPHLAGGRKGQVNLRQRTDFVRLARDRDGKSENSSESPTKAASNNAPVQYENTFKMPPENGHEFAPSQVESIVKDVLSNKLKYERYHSESCSKISQDICAAIKEKVKALGLQRYKIVTQVLIGQDTDQSVQMASRCLWNHSTDNFAAATYRNNSLYAIAIVYGVYMD